MLNPCVDPALFSHGLWKQKASVPLLPSGVMQFYHVPVIAEAAWQKASARSMPHLHN